MGVPANNIVPLERIVRGERGSRQVVRELMSHELIFGVVGHIGSGASQVADQLETALTRTSRQSSSVFEVHLLKARAEIIEWASAQRAPQGKPTQLEFISALQDLGDEMRRDTNDYSAVARALVARIRATRAAACNVELKPGEAVQPDETLRAYILDSIRHPAEVELLRQVYRSAFVLVGVVCDDDVRLRRIQKKFDDAGEQKARDLMTRDANAREKWGQKVSDAFHMSDFFLDNTAERVLEGEKPNPDWDVGDQLERLVKLLTIDQVVRPTVHELAMYTANGAAMGSACFSRQVGAALVDHKGNVVATGMNEVPRAGGGVYGTQLDDAHEVPDHRCSVTDLYEKKFCSNTREQTVIAEELLRELQPVVDKHVENVLGALGMKVDGKAASDQSWSKQTAAALMDALRRSRIGGLLEFSRAVHAEMDAIFAASRSGAAIVGSRLYVTTFPCHYCARHLVTAGVDEVQFIEPYPKSRALKLHADALTRSAIGWTPPSKGGQKVLIRPFRGIAPRLYERVFRKEVDLKDENGNHVIRRPEWSETWKMHGVSYAQLEAELAGQPSATSASK